MTVDRLEELLHARVASLRAPDSTSSFHFPESKDSMSSGVSFASRASSSSGTRSTQSSSGTVKYGTLLQSGATASYPTSFASSPQYNPSTPNSGSKLSGGVIAGIVVACVAFLLLVAFVIFLLVMRRKRANKQSKRLSSTALLPGPGTSLSGASQPQPDMVQRPNYASTGVTMPAATAVPAPANRKNRFHGVPGLSFGSGHRRTDSNNSTTPFLGSMPESPSRPSTGDTSFDANRSPTINRYSLESTTTYPGSPSMPTQGHFDPVQDGAAHSVPQSHNGRLL